MRIGSLFAGIGGFDLAASWLGWDTAWYSEIDPYASAVMKKRFPLAPNLGDITKIDGKQAAPVDLLCGGFPCQDISLAGKGAGLSGERSGLWSHYRRLIEEVAPQWVVIENVSALRSRGLDRVLGEIAALGYDAEWHCIPAAAVGAPHRRDRIWIIAHTDGDVRHARRLGVAGESTRGRDADRSRVGAYVADPASERPREERQLRLHESEERTACRCESLAIADPLREGCKGLCSASGVPTSQSSPCSPRWWATEPDVGRVAHGVPSRVDRLRCLGNAIVPQVAFVIFSAIARAEAA